MRVRKVCNNTENTDVIFGSQVTKITKHHFQPTAIVKQLLAAYLINDAIWDNTHPWDVTLYDTSGAQAQALVNVEVTKESIVTITTSISTKDKEIWYNAHEECDSWHNVPETMDNYKKWEDPPFILEDTSINNESPKEHIE